MVRASKQRTKPVREREQIMQVELPAAIEIATRGTLPSPYSRPFSSIGRSNSNASKRSSYAPRKESPGASRASRMNQKRPTSTVKTSLKEEQARSNLQPTASSSSTTVQSGGHYHPRSRHNSSGYTTSSKSHNYHQQQGQG